SALTRASICGRQYQWDGYRNLNARDSASLRKAALSRVVQTSISSGIRAWQRPMPPSSTDLLSLWNNSVRHRPLLSGGNWIIATGTVCPSGNTSTCHGRGRNFDVAANRVTVKTTAQAKKKMAPTLMPCVLLRMDRDLAASDFIRVASLCRRNLGAPDDKRRSMFEGGARAACA